MEKDEILRRIVDTAISNGITIGEFEKLYLEVLINSKQNESK